MSVIVCFTHDRKSLLFFGVSSLSFYVMFSCLPINDVYLLPKLELGGSVCVGFFVERQ